VRRPNLTREQVMQAARQGCVRLVLDGHAGGYDFPCEAARTRQSTRPCNLTQFSARAGPMRLRASLGGHKNGPGTVCMASLRLYEMPGDSLYAPIVAEGAVRP
jgi:hypothetical protein